MSALVTSPLIPVSPGTACVLVTLCSPVSAIGGAVSHVASDAARSTATAAALAVFHVLLAEMSAAVTTVIGDAGREVFGPGTGVSLGDAWFTREVEMMWQVTLALVLPMLCAASIGAVIRQDTSRLIRTWFVWLPLSIVLTFLIVPLTQVASTVTDDLSSLIGAPDSANAATALQPLIASIQTPGGGVLAGLVAVLLLAGGVVVWLEMVVRSSAILITVFFLPLVLAGMVWPATAHVVKRVLEVLVALIFSKFVVAAVLSLGLAAVGNGGRGLASAGARPLQGVAILLMAAFAPMALLRLVPIVEAAAIGHLEGRSRQPIRAATDVAGRAHRQFPAVAQMVGAGSRGGGVRRGASARSGAEGAGAGAQASGGAGSPVSAMVMAGGAVAGRAASMPAEAADLAGTSGGPGSAEPLVGPRHHQRGGDQGGGDQGGGEQRGGDQRGGDQGGGDRGDGHHGSEAWRAIPMYGGWDPQGGPPVSLGGEDES